MGITTQNPWTSQELCRLPEGWRYEIDEGELVIMAPSGFDHNAIASETARRLGNFVHDRKLGRVLTNETGVLLRREPRQVLRGIDVAFFSNERIARIADRKGFPDVPPELAVEVHAPDEPGMRRKIDQYLEAGVRSVWVIDPEGRTLTQYRSGETPVLLGDAGAVVQDPVLPGFSCRLHELFGEA